ncbi:MAG TPA: hypothetical protein VF979_00190, partial [Streptosporangiaceae bacterium]
MSRMLRKRTILASAGSLTVLGAVADLSAAPASAAHTPHNRAGEAVFRVPGADAAELAEPPDVIERHGQRAVP